MPSPESEFEDRVVPPYNDPAKCPNGTAPQFLHYYSNKTGVCLWCRKAKRND